MNFYEFAKKIHKAHELLLENKDIAVEEIEFEFEALDHSNGTVVKGNNIDRLTCNLLDPKKVILELS